MMMFFQHETVRRFLIDHGEVYTLRVKKDDKEHRVALRISKKEGFGKRIKKLVAVVPPCSPERLKSYVRKSGFRSPAQWLDEFLGINRRKALPPEIYVYHVKLLELTGDLKGSENR